MEDEKISVIVPIYGVEKYLSRCVESILRQTYQNLEILLIDDGSLDACGAICDEYAKKDCRVRVLHKENGGLSSARNAGIKMASGEYLAFVDSDDFIQEDMYTKLMSILKRNQADIAMCKMQKVMEGEKPISLPIIEEEKVISYDDFILSTILSDEYGNFAWNKLYKKELFDDILFPLHRKYEDVAIMCKIFANAKKVIATNYIGYYYFYGRQGSISTEKKDEKTLFDNLQAYEERYHFLCKKAGQKVVEEIKVEFIRAVLGIHEGMYVFSLEQLKNNLYVQNCTKEMLELCKNVDFNVLYRILGEYKVATLMMLLYDKKVYEKCISDFYKAKQEKRYKEI